MYNDINNRKKRVITQYFRKSCHIIIFDYDLKLFETESYVVFNNDLLSHHTIYQNLFYCAFKHKIFVDEPNLKPHFGKFIVILTISLFWAKNPRLHQSH